MKSGPDPVRRIPKSAQQSLGVFKTAAAPAFPRAPRNAHQPSPCHSCAVVPSEDPTGGCWARAEPPVETPGRKTHQGPLRRLRAEERIGSKPKAVEEEGQASKNSRFKLMSRLVRALTRTGNGGRRLRPLSDCMTRLQPVQNGALVSSWGPSPELRRASGWSHPWTPRARTRPWDTDKVQRQQQHQRAGLRPLTSPPSCSSDTREGHPGGRLVKRPALDLSSAHDFSVRRLRPPWAPR